MVAIPRVQHCLIGVGRDGLGEVKGRGLECGGSRGDTACSTHRDPQSFWVPVLLGHNYYPRTMTSRGPHGDGLDYAQGDVPIKVNLDLSLPVVGDRDWRMDGVGDGVRLQLDCHGWSGHDGQGLVGNVKG